MSASLPKASEAPRPTPRMSNQALIRKLRDHSAVIGIVGMGYVGLPLMLRFVDVGYRVLGFDIDRDKVERLNRGESYLEHIPGPRVKAARAKGFVATADYSQASGADALIILPNVVKD